MMTCASKLGIEVTVTSDELYACIGELPKGTAITKKILIALFDNIVLERGGLHDE